MGSFIPAACNDYTQATGKFSNLRVRENCKQSNSLPVVLANKNNETVRAGGGTTASHIHKPATIKTPINKLNGINL
jgi:hypothetical protein